MGCRAFSTRKAPISSSESRSSRAARCRPTSTSSVGFSVLFAMFTNSTIGASPKKEPSAGGDPEASILSSIKKAKNSTCLFQKILSKSSATRSDCPMPNRPQRKSRCRGSGERKRIKPGSSKSGCSLSAQAAAEPSLSSQVASSSAVAPPAAKEAFNTPSGTVSTATRARTVSSLGRAPPAASAGASTTSSTAVGAAAGPRARMAFTEWPVRISTLPTGISAARPLMRHPAPASPVKCLSALCGSPPQTPSQSREPETSPRYAVLSCTESVKKWTCRAAWEAASGALKRSPAHSFNCRAADTPRGARPLQSFLPNSAAKLRASSIASSLSCPKPFACHSILPLADATVGQPNRSARRKMGLPSAKWIQFAPTFAATPPKLAGSVASILPPNLPEASNSSTRATPNCRARLWAAAMPAKPPPTTTTSTCSTSASSASSPLPASADTTPCAAAAPAAEGATAAAAATTAAATPLPAQEGKSCSTASSPQPGVSGRKSGHRRTIAGGTMSEARWIAGEYQAAFRAGARSSAQRAGPGQGVSRPEER
mmetsp:Transcript_169179/g.543833  ORF Transcript_169179/g.543833 Transcript_169179/m.543833 type:complete len:543 (-) Transcript_169179:907-2535(-)